VFGTHDAYAGGFVYVVDLVTLAIERRTNTPAPVSAVFDCDDDDTLLIATYKGLVLWAGGGVRTLPIGACEASLSPSGRLIATASDGLRIWSIGQLGPAVDRPGGFPACFDPSGERLVTDTRLYDGRSGAPIAELAAEFTPYLEGGPASPWFHLGERHLIALHGGLRAWDTRTGAAQQVRKPLHFPHWYALAYDRAGARLAALRLDHTEVALHEIPGGDRLATIRFDLAGAALAMSADATTIAVRRGPAIEVRSADGALRARLAHPIEHLEPRARRMQDDTLHLSADGRRLASFHEADGWRLWDLADDGNEHLPARADLESSEFAALRPRDWEIEPGTSTRFLHRPSGTRIALPATGPWHANPGDPRILASDDLHLELREGSRG
jgi:hypothetical protein